jgi:signal transduction histidine kinase
VEIARSTDPVDAERIRAVYAQLPLALAVVVINATLVAVVFSPFTSTRGLLCWLGGVYTVAALRMIGCCRYRRSDQEPAHFSFWVRQSIVGALLSGALWGLGAVVFFPPTDVGQLFLALVIAGMCAGAATVHAPHIPTVVAFILPATIPLAARFLAAGGALQVIFGIMILIFGLALCIASFRFQSWFIGTFSAQIRLAERSNELDAANARLTQEISSRLLAEQKLQQSQKMEAIGRLTAAVAHDFNNLLMVVSGIAERMDRRLGPSSAHAGDLAAILHATRRGASLTRQLLAFGRRQPLVPRPTDLNGVLTGMQTLLETTLAGRRVEMRLDAGLEPVLVDTEQIERAILNLTTNARDALPDGGRVTIATAIAEIVPDQKIPDLPLGRYVKLTVADDGVGMEEDVRVRAIEPFFTTKEVGKGSGFGLSQVHGLVHQSGGTLTIESSPGRGTTVVIYLPVAGAVANESRLISLARRSQPDHDDRDVPKPVKSM